MKRVAKETHQVDNSVIAENIVIMSREHGIPVTIETLGGKVYTGIVMSRFCAVTGDVSAFYMRLAIEGSQMHERHAVIPIASIDSLTFETEKGLLDNLVK